LNAKFYSNIPLSLEGEALRGIALQKHIQADGLCLMQEIIQTYRPKKVPEVIAMKTAEFWRSMKHSPYEIVNDYYNQFHDLLDDLSDADTRQSISTEAYSGLAYNFSPLSGLLQFCKTTRCS
jgi:hypothetical protein